LLKEDRGGFFFHTHPDLSPRGRGVKRKNRNKRIYFNFPKNAKCVSEGRAAPLTFTPSPNKESRVYKNMVFGEGRERYNFSQKIFVLSY
jgi:hypothetical protein